jgi:hypothetical protein
VVEAPVTGDLLRHYPVFDTRIDCAGQSHRLRWEAGRLHALDHEDLEGERALAALGGQACPCVEALDRWARHADDLRVLTLTSRGPTDAVRWPDPSSHSVIPLTGRTAPGRPSGGGRFPAGTHATIGIVPTQGRPVPARGSAIGPVVHQVATGWVATAAGSVVSGNAGPQPLQVDRDELAALLTLSGGLVEKLAVTVAAAWVRRLNPGLAGAADDRGTSVAAVRPALVAALHGRVACSVRQWLGDPWVPIEVEMIDGGGLPAVSRPGAAVEVALPFAWVVDVWGRGLAVVMDRFVLGVVSSTPDRLELLTVDGTFSAPRTVTIGLP